MKKISLIAALAASLAAPAAVAAEKCASADEVEAFRLRHLQTRLMVAALSCGQKDAYNQFITFHRDLLGTYGPRLITYYNRAGGAKALNQYVTDLANAAAAIRSDDPEAFCAHTWNVFWELSEKPADLTTLAAANPIPAVSQPSVCVAPVKAPAPKTQTAQSSPKQTAPPKGAAVQ